ncbi:unnamed protein product, partial [Ectocarpus sp. 12 AP-2014]
ARDEVSAQSSLSSSSSSTECLECPVLRESLAERSAEVENAREQQLAAQSELEASEHRVHVMAADIASLQRKLAEHADVIRQGRALADKVVAAPEAGTPQVQAAQNFKELSDKVANARGECRGKKRSPKGQAAAARGRRLGRGGSKLPSPPSSRGAGRRRSSVLPRAGGGGGGSSGDGDGKQRGRSSRSSRASSSQQRRRSARSSSDSISGGKSDRSSAQREAVENSGGDGGGQQTRSAESSSEAGPPPLLIDKRPESMVSQEEPATKGVEVSDSAVAQDRSQDNNVARNQQQPGGNGSGTQDDAVEQSDVTGMVQRQDGAPGDTSAVEKTLAGNALDGETVPTRPPLQGAASTSDPQDGSETSPPVPPSSATGHKQQEEDSGPVDLEGSGIV